MTKFRFHRGSLEESMKTVVEVATLTDLCGELNSAEVAGPGVDLHEAQIHIEHYIMDDRIGWDTWVVTACGRVLGFTNGFLSSSPPATLPGPTPTPKDQA